MTFRRTSRHRTVLAVVLLAATSSAGAQSGDAKAGAMRFEQRDYTGARTEFEAILRRNDRDANALHYVGRIALEEGRSGEAVDWLERAVAAEDRNASYHFWLGAALGQEAQRANKLRQPFLARRVKTEFERAVTLDPRNVQARFGLVQFYAVAPGVMGGGMDKAREQVAGLLAVSPLHGHVGAAFLAQRQKDTVAMIRAYELAIGAAPDSTLGYLSLGAAYQRLERWTEATATYDRLLRRVPDEPVASFQLGRVAAYSGQNLERGERGLRTYLARPPRSASRNALASAHALLGRIMERRDRHDAARAEYEEALRINPKNDDARKWLAALRS